MLPLMSCCRSFGRYLKWGHHRNSSIYIMGFDLINLPAIGVPPSKSHTWCVVSPISKMTIAWAAPHLEPKQQPLTKWIFMWSPNLKLTVKPTAISQIYLWMCGFGICRSKMVQQASVSWWNQSKSQGTSRYFKVLNPDVTGWVSVMFVGL